MPSQWMERPSEGGLPGERRGPFPASPITSFCAGLGVFPPPCPKLAAAPASSPDLAQVCPRPKQVVQGRGWNGVGATMAQSEEGRQELEETSAWGGGWSTCLAPPSGDSGHSCFPGPSSHAAP